jgi:hypothetical protein
MSFSLKKQLEEAIGQVNDKEFEKARKMAIEDLIANNRYTENQIKDALDEYREGTDIEIIRGEIIATTIISLRILTRTKSK